MEKKETKILSVIYFFFSLTLGMNSQGPRVYFSASGDRWEKADWHLLSILRQYIEKPVWNTDVFHCTLTHVGHTSTLLFFEIHCTTVISSMDFFFLYWIHKKHQLKPKNILSRELQANTVELRICWTNLASFCIYRLFMNILWFVWICSAGQREFAKS